MSTTQIVRGPFRHRDVFHIDAFSTPTTDCSCEAPPKKRLSNEEIARIAEQEIAAAFAPVMDRVNRISDKLDEVKAQRDRARAQRDARREAERTAPPPSNYVRAVVTGEIRPRTTLDDLVASRLHYGRDAGGRRPGEPGYQFDGEAMLKAGASLGEIHRAFWGREA